MERGLINLFHKELTLAQESEMLKQQLVTSYDFSYDKLMMELDDCNLKFIDTSALKRFLNKNAVSFNSSTIVGIIRRIDLDADAKLNQREFFEAVLPLEGFTKLTHNQFKKAFKARGGSPFKDPVKKQRSPSANKRKRIQSAGAT